MLFSKHLLSVIRNKYGENGQAKKNIIFLGKMHREIILGIYYIKNIKVAGKFT
ncbi:MAG: hypothetical protein JSS91_02515 [Bacteroidetes bacterium]|nr:hypothetical protein [Bacteroidota bacterium]